MSPALPRKMLLFFLFLAFPFSARADPNLVSANGFACVKSQSLVTCQGQFPGLPGTISASGSYGVQITYDTPGVSRKRYLYDSTTGCLMQIILTPSGEATQATVRNATGNSQSFPLPGGQAQAMSFCRS